MTVTRGRVGGGVGGAGVSSGVVYGSAGVGVGEVHAGDASEGKKVRLVRLGAGTEEAGHVGCDAHSCGRCILLDEWDGGKDGVSD